MDTPLVSGVRVSFQLSQFLQEKLRARDYNMFYCHFYSEIYRQKTNIFQPENTTGATATNNCRNEGIHWPCLNFSLFNTNTLFKFKNNLPSFYFRCLNEIGLRKT